MSGRDGWDGEDETLLFGANVTADASGTARGTIDVIYRSDRPEEAFLDGEWRAVDVCTRNRVYGLDARLRCIVVIDRATGEHRTEHKLLGAHLVGGQRREADRTMVSHPFPEIGMAAVFERRNAKGRPGYVETSEVIRVIVRQRLLDVPDTDEAPRWRRITGGRD